LPEDDIVHLIRLAIEQWQEALAINGFPTRRLGAARRSMSDQERRMS
jgi:hypothetical protein